MDLAFFYYMNIFMNQNTSAPILTTDGIPLKVSLKKSERINKFRAFLLVLPLLIFILNLFYNSYWRYVS